MASHQYLAGLQESEGNNDSGNRALSTSNPTLSEGDAEREELLYEQYNLDTAGGAEANLAWLREAHVAQSTPTHAAARQSKVLNYAVLQHAATHRWTYTRDQYIVAESLEGKSYQEMAHDLTTQAQRFSAQDIETRLSELALRGPNSSHLLPRSWLHNEIYIPDLGDGQVMDRLQENELAELVTYMARPGREGDGLYTLHMFSNHTTAVRLRTAMRELEDIRRQHAALWSVLVRFYTRPQDVQSRRQVALQGCNQCLQRAAQSCKDLIQHVDGDIGFVPQRHEVFEALRQATIALGSITCKMPSFQSVALSLLHGTSTMPLKAIITICNGETICHQTSAMKAASARRNSPVKTNIGTADYRIYEVAGGSDTKQR